MNKQNARIKRAFIYKSITSKVGAVSGENKISEILQLTSRFSVLYIYKRAYVAVRVNFHLKN